MRIGELVLNLEKKGGNKRAAITTKSWTKQTYERVKIEGLVTRKTKERDKEK